MYIMVMRKKKGSQGLLPGFWHEPERKELPSMRRGKLGRAGLGSEYAG